MHPVPTEQSTLYRFGEFALDTQSGELRRNGCTVRLQPQPLQVLLLLIQHSGQIVTRDQLQTSLWEQGTYVEFEDALNHAIRRLRTALGDTADVPQYIETVPRRGYRFIVPVETGTAETAGVPPPVAPATSPWRRLWWYAAAAALCCALATMIVFRMLTAHPLPKINSIAVLPFTNLSGDPQQEYFVDGVTDTLTAELSQISSLRVISRTSAMHYKGSKEPVPKIARELGVDGILEGSVARSGNRIRVTAQLIYAPSDSHLWARSYERDVHDVLSLQSELTLAIADGVRAQVTAEEKSRLAHLPGVAPEAYDLYIQGRYWWGKRNQEGTRKAIECFQHAIALDPNYAIAYSGLADALRLATAFQVLPREGVKERQKAAAETAVRLDEQSAEAHTSLAAVYQAELQWERAELEYRRAIKLNPNYAVAHHWYAGQLLLQSRLDEAMPQAIAAQQLDPLYFPVALTRAEILRLLGNLDAADAQLQRVLQIDPDFLMAHCLRRSLREDQGRFPEAIDEDERCSLPADQKEQHERAVALRAAWAQGGARGYWTQRLRFGQEDFRRQQDGEFEIIRSYAHLGDKEQALTWLAQGDCRKMIGVGLHEPVMQEYRSDPRFQRFLRCLNLEPQSPQS
jgi:TolB-like protein/DNA-binding winged helix-turn-helix (wHTH) protein